MLKEFKEFALKGNMIDLAVGVIIGGAFNGLVTSLVNDVIMPLLGILTGKLDFSNLFLALDGNTYATLAEAEAAEAAVVKYGSFISGVINFVIMAFVVFVIVKMINTARKKMEAPKPVEAPKTQTCPYCQSEISVKATRCPNCTTKLKGWVEPKF